MGVCILVADSLLFVALYEQCFAWQAFIVGFFRDSITAKFTRHQGK